MGTMKILKSVPVFVLFSLLVSCFSTFAEEAYVKKVIDGDTIVLSTGQKVRYIGIDAPEIHHKNKDVVAMGKRAKEFNGSLVLGKNVRLKYDVETHDKYGRILAYVYVGTVFVNAAMIENGYAQVYTLPPNVKYQELLLSLQKQARDSSKGLWKEITQNTSPSSLPPSASQFVASENAESFHFLWCKWAKKISPKNRVYYSTREEAMKALHRPCHVCKP